MSDSRSSGFKGLRGFPCLAKLRQLWSPRRQSPAGTALSLLDVFGCGRPETAGRRARGQLATGRMAPKVTPTKKKASPLVAAISAALLKSAKQSKGTTVASRGRKAQTRRDKRG